MSAHSTRPDDLIEAYVADVIRRLPGRQRNDVGFELRALLREELRGRAADAGRLADAAMTLDFLRAFGNPDDVAARYHPPGDPVIPAGHTRGFVWATVIGLALQWLTTLPMAISANAGQDAAWIGRWWLTHGLGAFWWPGFLVTMSMAAAFIRQRWPAAAIVWKPKGVDRDHVNRPLFALGLALALAGIGLWVALVWWATTSTGTSPVAKVFAFDADFLATRAPVVLLYWAVGIVLLIVVMVEGRWRELTRRLDMALKLICCAMLAWFVFGGRIFVADATNDPVRGILVLLIIGLLADVAWRLWRGRSRIHAPDGVATGA
jgi:hypothetical protein